MALALSGSTSRVEYTSTLAATTAMSWCGWVENPIATGTTCKMLACQEEQWRFSLNAEKYGGGTPTAGSLYFARSWSTTDHIAQVQSPGATWSAKNHVAVTYDGASASNVAKIYLNGSLLTNSYALTAVGSIDNATGNPNLGNDNAHARGATGTYGPSSFHNVVLTLAEILEHMATGYTPRGRYVDWWCDDATTVIDRSGNGRSGTVTSAAIAAGPPIRRTLFVSPEWTKAIAAAAPPAMPSRHRRTMTGVGR